MIGNKIDLENNIKVQQSDLYEITDGLRIPIVLTSAYTGESVDAAFTLMIQ